MSGNRENAAGKPFASTPNLLEPPFSLDIFDDKVTKAYFAGQSEATGHSQVQKLLPASYRTGSRNPAERTVAVATANVAEFLRVELDVQRLNDIHGHLWLAGLPAAPRPLHVQRVKEREIIVSEQMDLHLVWQPKRIYIKPLPRYLLDVGFWETHLCGKPARTDANAHGSALDVPGAQLASTAGAGNGDDTANASDGDDGFAALHQCALGFLLSYMALIAHESDYRIAHELGLLPNEVKWPQWVQLAAEVLSNGARARALEGDDKDTRRASSGGGNSSSVPYHLRHYPDVNRRFHYGELRLGRLNLVYRLRKGHLQYGYMGSNSAHASYGSYFRRNASSLLTIFAYVTIVLSAMQVALATRHGASNTPLQLASYVFALLALIVPLAFLLAIAVAMLALFSYNWKATMAFIRQRFAPHAKKSPGGVAAGRGEDARPTLDSGNPV